MVKKWILFLLCIFLTGCSTMMGWMSSPHPGTIFIPGGRVQLFYSNPNADLYGPHMLGDTSYILENRVGQPTVTGGIGVMAIWKF